MKLETQHRYVAWDSNGDCYSFTHPPRPFIDEWLVPAPGDYYPEIGYRGIMEGSMATIDYFDTEADGYENVIKALLEL